jgi:hypothetical protein
MEHLTTLSLRKAAMIKLEGKQVKKIEVFSDDNAKLALPCQLHRFAADRFDAYCCVIFFVRCFTFFSLSLSSSLSLSLSLVMAAENVPSFLINPKSSSQPQFGDAGFSDFLPTFFHRPPTHSSDLPLSSYKSLSTMLSGQHKAQFGDTAIERSRCHSHPIIFFPSDLIAQFFLFSHSYLLFTHIHSPILSLLLSLSPPSPSLSFCFSPAISTSTASRSLAARAPSSAPSAHPPSPSWPPSLTQA